MAEHAQTKCFQHELSNRVAYSLIPAFVYSGLKRNDAIGFVDDTDPCRLFCPFYPKSFLGPLLYNVLRCRRSPISKIRELSVRLTIAEHSALIHCVRPQHTRRERRTMEIPDTGCTAALAPKLGDWCADTPVGQVPVVSREDSGSQLRLSDVRAMASDLAA